LRILFSWQHKTLGLFSITALVLDWSVVSVEFTHTTMDNTSHKAGALGDRVSIKCALSYAILQAMFISASIATDYRLMVYHINFVHVDLSKIAPLSQIWSIFLEITRLTPANLYNHTAQPSDISSRLDQLLYTYQSSHKTAIRVYKV